MSRKVGSGHRTGEFVPPVHQRRFVSRVKLLTKQTRTFRGEIRDLYHATDGLACFDQETMYRIPLELTPARAYIGRLRLPRSNKPRGAENQPENGNTAPTTDKSEGEIANGAIGTQALTPDVAERDLTEHTPDLEEEDQDEDGLDVPNLAGTEVHHADTHITSSVPASDQ
jgi:hypothetical protein